jgi:hypothetical protein
MTMEVMVQAWQLGYDCGRTETLAECECPTTRPRTDNVVMLDDYRRPTRLREGTR